MPRPIFELFADRADDEPLLFSDLDLPRPSSGAAVATSLSVVVLGTSAPLANGLEVAKPTPHAPLAVATPSPQPKLPVAASPQAQAPVAASPQSGAASPQPQAASPQPQAPVAASPQSVAASPQQQAVVTSPQPELPVATPSPQPELPVATPSPQPELPVATPSPQPELPVATPSPQPELPVATPSPQPELPVATPSPQPELPVATPKSHAPIRVPPTTSRPDPRPEVKDVLPGKALHPAPAPPGAAHDLPEKPAEPTPTPPAGTAVQKTLPASKIPVFRGRPAAPGELPAADELPGSRKTGWCASATGHVVLGGDVEVCPFSAGERLDVNVGFGLDIGAGVTYDTSEPELAPEPRRVTGELGIKAGAAGVGAGFERPLGRGEPWTGYADSHIGLKGIIGPSGMVGYTSGGDGVFSKVGVGWALAESEPRRGRPPKKTPLKARIRKGFDAKIGGSVDWELR